MKSRIGIFSGTFDPVHPGHITFAEEALNVCKLDKVVFLPEEEPRGKRNVTDIFHRLELLKLAIENNKKLEIIKSDSQQFTVKNTLPELQNMFKDTSLTLLVGSDVVKTFIYRWEDLGMLLSNVSLAIGMRSHDTKEEILVIIKNIETDLAIEVNYSLIQTLNMDVTSSGVRNNHSITSRLNPAVDAYIKRHHLYNQ